jgi:hypothetical protein
MIIYSENCDSDKKIILSIPKNQNPVQKLKRKIIMTQEITLTLDRNLIQMAERFAVKQSLSVQQMLSDVLASKIVQLDSDQYEQAKRAAFKEMDAGYHLGGKPASREELYDR